MTNEVYNMDIPDIEFECQFQKRKMRVY